MVIGLNLLSVGELLNFDEDCGVTWGATSATLDFDRLAARAIFSSEAFVFCRSEFTFYVFKISRLQPFLFVEFCTT